MWANQKSSPSAAVATPLRAQWARDLAQGQELCNLPKFWLSDPHIMHRKAKVFPLQIMSHLLLLPKYLLHLHRCSIPFPFKMQAQNSYLLPILWLQSLPKIWMMPHPLVPQKNGKHKAMRMPHQYFIDLAASSIAEVLWKKGYLITDKLGIIFSKVKFINANF